LPSCEPQQTKSEEATPGPWKADHHEYPETVYGTDKGGLNVYVIAGSRWGGEASVFDNNDDAYHIALWHPGIAELVAQILAAAAIVAEEEAPHGTNIEVVLREELALARAINATEVA
jgi:hypothetical protein